MLYEVITDFGYPDPLLASLPIVLGLRRRRRGTRRVLAVAVALGLTLAVQFALFGILQRLQADPLEVV